MANPVATPLVTLSDAAVGFSKPLFALFLEVRGEPHMMEAGRPKRLERRNNTAFDGLG
jgi:hypothetical protein